MTKTKTQKAKAKAARAIVAVAANKMRAQPPRGAGRNKNKKWYLGIDTAWGSLNAGSGEPTRQKGGRSVGGMAGSTEYNSAPTVRNNIIINDELIAQVNGSETFLSVAYPVQPGCPTTFPWLSKLAVLYQKYRFRRICFYYKPLVGVFADAGVKGKVALAADMDAAGENLVSIQQTETYDPHVDALLTQNACLDIDVRLLGTKPIRGLVLPPGANANVYDVAKLFMCSYATPNTEVIGELHVKYEVELLCPMLSLTTSLVTNNKLYDVTLNSASLTSGVVTVSALSTERLNGIQAVNTAGVITLQQGLYAWHYNAVCTNGGAGITQVQLSMVVPGGQPSQPGHVSQFPAEATCSGSMSGVLRISAPTDISLTRYCVFASGTTLCTDFLSIVAL